MPEEMKTQLEIYKNLHPASRATCQHPECRTLTLRDYCTKHRPHVAPVPTITMRSIRK